MAYEDELPTKLRMERARMKLTQAQVAEAIGTTSAAICLYEQGERVPTLQKLTDIASFYNVSIDYLVGRQ